MKKSNFWKNFKSSLTRINLKNFQFIVQIYHILFYNEKFNF